MAYMEATVRIILYRELRPSKGIPYTRAHLARLEAAGLFPAHLDIGPSRIGWVEAEIDEYLETRAAARPPKTDMRQTSTKAEIVEENFPVAKLPEKQRVAPTARHPTRPPASAPPATKARRRA